LPDHLRSQGAEVNEIHLYEAIAHAGVNQKELEDIKAGRFDYLTFTSSSTVDNFVKLVGSEHIPLLNEKVRIACIGPITAETAAGYGFDIHISADSFTIDGLMEALIEDRVRK
jgi:uroporphyrinogen III methyltransferase/synthase